MQNVLDLNRRHLPIGEQSFADNPDPHFQAALKQHTWLATDDFGIVIPERDAAIWRLFPDV